MPNFIKKNCKSCICIFGSRFENEVPGESCILSSRSKRTFCMHSVRRRNVASIMQALVNLSVCNLSFMTSDALLPLFVTT